MPLLGDYLGHLLAEITRARVHADVEAMRVAQLYSTHPLLRTLPAPRFRLPSVELDVPIAIRGIQQQEEGTPPPEEPGLGQAREVFERVLRAGLAARGVREKASVMRDIRSELDKITPRVSTPSGTPLDVTGIAREFSAASARILHEAGAVDGEDARKTLEEELRETVRSELVALRRPPLRLEVQVATHEIREIGQKDAVTFLHLRVTEECLEWTTVETSDGKESDRLQIE